MRRAGTAELASLLAIEDPFAYRDRLSIPKFVINSAGDQYFLPDSSRFYFDALIGEKYLRYVPNTDHSFKGSDARESMLAFYHAIGAGQPRPRFSWSFAPDGAIEVKAATRPLAAVLWQATNPETRDFRLEAIGPAYRSSMLEPDGDGTYRASVPEPARGWVAHFLELTFASGGPFPVQIHYRSPGRTRDVTLRPAARYDVRRAGNDRSFRLEQIPIRLQHQFQLSLRAQRSNRTDRDPPPRDCFVARCAPRNDRGNLAKSALALA
jgi:hypothetical protein